MVKQVTGTHYASPHKSAALMVASSVQAGLDGWKRNLEPEEILGQLLAIEHHFQPKLKQGQERKVNNLVIMGMGRTHGQL